MKKQRFIIEIQGEISPAEAFGYAAVVANGGLTSGSDDKLQHCYASKFNDGTWVYCIKNKGSERFVVRSKVEDQLPQAFIPAHLLAMPPHKRKEYARTLNEMEPVLTAAQKARKEEE